MVTNVDLKRVAIIFWHTWKSYNWRFEPLGMRFIYRCSPARDFFLGEVSMFFSQKPLPFTSVVNVNCVIAT